MRNEYLWIAVVGLTWGGYPLLARWAGYSGPRATMVLMVAAMLPIGYAMFSATATASGWPSQIALLKLIGAGVMMGVGLLAFHAVMTSPMDASITIPISDTAMLLVSTIGAMFFFSEPVTLQKIGGIVLLLGGIALLR